jgi:hypothetical protein
MSVSDLPAELSLSGDDADDERRPDEGRVKRWREPRRASSLNRGISPEQTEEGRV